MRYGPSHILNLLADGRIDVAEAERLLAIAGLGSGLGSGLGQRLLGWAPVAAMAAPLVLDHAALQLLCLRAAEASRLIHFHVLLPR